MKKHLILATLWLLSLSITLPTHAYTDAQVDAKVTELKWIINLIFSKPKDKEKYQYAFKEIFQGCAKTCKNELSKLASAMLLETYDEDFLWVKKEDTNRVKYKLDAVSDWDTIKVIDEKWISQSVRMIGLDSPESYATRFGYTECFWKEASNYLKTLLKDVKEVELEFDSTQWATDKYWRLLAYVFYNWENINKKMIADGYGWEYTYNLPYKYQTEFKEAMKSAEKNNLGLWNEKACNWERTTVEEIDTTSTTKPSNVCLNHTWILWPKWGCYYIDEAWGKVYWDHACCGR